MRSKLVDYSLRCSTLMGITRDTVLFVGVTCATHSRLFMRRRHNMRHRIEIVGEDAQELIDMLRTMGADLHVEVIEQTEPSLDPLDDIAFFVERMNAHMQKLTSLVSAMRNMDNKLLRIRDAAERNLSVNQQMLSYMKADHDAEMLKMRSRK